VSVDGAHAGELVLPGIDLEGAFDVLNAPMYLRMVNEPLVASDSLDHEPIDVALGLLEFRDELIGDA
jgi:hypothetical protein